MANYDHIALSKIAFGDEMCRIYDEALEDAANLILQNEYFKGGKPVFNSDRNDYTGYVELETTQVKAWIVEYGSGEHMRQDNPFLDEYKRSEYYNPLRRYRGDSILTWGNRDYNQINYEENKIDSRHGSGTAGNLTPFQGVAPEPFLEDLMKQALQEFKNSVAKKLSSFRVNVAYIPSNETV